LRSKSKFNRISVINCTTKLTQGALKQIKLLSKSEVNFVPQLPRDDSETVKAIGDSDAVVASLSVDMTENIFAGTPNLRYLGICGSNLRRVDLKSASQYRVHVANVREYCDWDTALFVITELLSLTRGLGAKMWREELADIRAKTLGILGLGAVGLNTAKLATSLGMRVRYFSRTRKTFLETSALHYGSKEEVIAASDFVSIHTPPHTIVLAGNEFDYFRQGTTLIVTSVGNTIEESGFRRWMDKGKNYAIFDSIAGEYCPKLVNSERVIISNRPAYLTTESRTQLCEKLVGEMMNFLDGTPL
jgi:phosphoglycerate dehydrogenase-like enzyme